MDRMIKINNKLINMSNLTLADIDTNNEINADSFDYVTQPRWRDYENWMSDASENVKNTPLNKLGLPGTHDSGTYELYTDEIYDVDDFTGIAPTIAGPIIRALAVTQNANIYAQLMEGTRYIDLRFAKDQQGRIRIVHTVFGEDATAIFDQIRSFLNSHPKEVVIVDIQNINNLNNDDQERLYNTVASYIGDRAAVRGEFSPSATLNDFYNKNVNAIILYPDSNFANQKVFYWDRNSLTIQNPWYDTNDINYLLQKNTEGIDNLPNVRPYFYVSQMVLTVNSSEIVNIILDLLKWLPIPIYGQIRFVEEFNKLVKTPGIYNITAPHYSQIQNWLVENSPVEGKRTNGIFPNITILDFYQKQNIGTQIKYNDFYN